MYVETSYQRSTKHLVVNGVEKNVITLDIAGQSYVVQPGLVTSLRLEDEWGEDVRDPHRVITELKRHGSLGIDLFTFWERPPNTTSSHAFHLEAEAVAALPIFDYENWFSKQATQKCRNMVRKAKKNNVMIYEAKFDSKFIDGMVRIFNESPIRQGREFWHFGKDADVIRRQFGRFLFRERLYGAYWNGELIGFIFIAIHEKYANLVQIISMIEHRSKAPNNALIAKAVEVCAEARIPWLTYANWPPPGGLAHFKQDNGFQRIDVPRYFVPITWKGRLALKAGMHRDWKDVLPDSFRARLKQVKARLVQLGQR